MKEFLTSYRSIPRKCRSIGTTVIPYERISELFDNVMGIKISLATIIRAGQESF